MDDASPEATPGSGRIRRTRAPAVTPGTRLVLGDCLVNFDAHCIERAGTTVAIEPRMMAVLAELCRHPGEVLSAEALSQICSPGEILGDNPIHKVIAGLRRALGDSATASTYIETIRKQGYRLIAPIRLLSEQGPRSGQGSWRGQSPFRGLEPFDRDHAAVFFGRDPAIAALHARLDAQWQRRHPLVILLGPSGSGKTSLVQAGLIPALFAPREDESRAAPALRAATAATIDLGAAGEFGIWFALAGALLDWERDDAPLLPGHSIESLAGLLSDDIEGCERLIRHALSSDQKSAAAAPPLLVLDRLEAIFQLGNEALVNAFLHAIDRLVRTRLVLVLALCRNDFYSSLAAHPLLMRDKEHGAHMDLAPPDAEAISQIIRLPARAAGLVYGMDPTGLNRLDDRLCTDSIHARDGLPLLQYALQELYRNRATGDELTWAAYEEIGGIEGAIGQRAEATLSSLPASQQQALTRLLPRLVGLPVEDAAPTSRWVFTATIVDEDERALVQALIEARLLVADHLGGQPGVRVAHEALLRSWPRITAWVAQHRATLVIRDELLPWVQRWLAGSRAAGLLLPQGAMLLQAAAAITESPLLFSADARAYIAQSQARLRSQARWRWLAVAGGAFLAIFAVIAAARYAALAKIAATRELQSQRLASFMLGDLADQLRPIGKLDLLSRIGEQGLSALGETGQQGESPFDIIQRAKALVVIGEVNSSRGQGRTETAAAALTQAHKLLEASGGPPENLLGDYWKTLGASYFWLGQIAYDRGDLDEAAQQMNQYRLACDRWLAAAPNDATAKEESGFALNSLGSISVQSGAWDEADRSFEAALKLKLEAEAVHPEDPNARNAVASSRIWLGLVARVRGNPRKAIELLNAALETDLALQTAHPTEFVRMRELGALQVRRAETQRDLGDYGAAVRTMDDAIAWFNKAVNGDPSNRRWQAERAHAIAGLLMAKSDAGLEPGDSLTELRRQLAQAGDTATSNPLWRETTARLAQIEAEYAARRGDWPGAERSAADSEQRLHELLAARPQDWRLRELNARQALWRIQAPASQTSATDRDARCRQTVLDLQPAVDKGQAGVVLETHLVAAACADHRAVDEADLQRVIANGYHGAAAQHFPAAP